MQTEGQIASPTRTGREEQLQFLRFWAFFNVFVCHGEQWLFFKYPTSHCSTAAVSFFFMLSGLVTALASFNKDIRLSWAGGREVPVAQGEENLSPVLVYDAVPFPLYQHGELDRAF